MINKIRNYLNEGRLKAIAAKTEGKILDIGCSDIQNKYLDSGNTIGIDLKVPDNSIYEVVESDLNKRIPFDDGSFDTVTAGEVLEHLENPSLALREIFRVLKSGGKAVITIPNGWLDMIMMFFNKSREHIIIFSPNMFKILLTRAGFSNIEYKRITKWYLFTASK